MMIQANISAPCTCMDFPSLDRFVQEISENQYDIIGISSILANIGKVKVMCELIRKHQPAATIVIGGHIANLPDLAQRIDADHIVRGEGVLWFRRFLGEDENKPICHIATYSFFDFRVLGADMPDKINLSSAVLIPSVGCPKGCNFCSTSAMFGGKGSFVNFFESGDELFAVLCGLEKELGVQEFLALDENFLLHRTRALRLLELIEKHDKPWAFHIFSSADVLNSYDISELVRLGIRWVWVGLEGEGSCYQKLKAQDTRKLVRELQSHGISVVGSSIIGLEEQTPENIAGVIEYAVSHECDYHQFMLYMPLPVTPLYSELAAKGLLFSPEQVPLADWHGQGRFAHLHNSIKTGQESKFLLQAFQRDFEVNGPGILRAIRTALAGWKRYRNHPQSRIRLRFARQLEGLATFQIGALWAGRRWFKDNQNVVTKLTEVMDEIYAECGLKARLAAPVFGRSILKSIKQEAARLAKGWTREPHTFYEKNYSEVVATNGAARERAAMARWLPPVSAEWRVGSKASVRINDIDPK